MAPRPLSRAGSIVAALALSGALLAACAGLAQPDAPAANDPTGALQAGGVPAATHARPTDTGAAPAATPSQDQVEAGIQEALDLYVKAYNENDVDLLMRVVDQANPPFRRYVRARFEDEQRSALGAGFSAKLKLAYVTRRDLGLAQAHITYGGSAADWLFRQVGDRWVLAEPTPDQLGKPIVVRSEHFIFTTYQWADDVNGKLIEMMEQARKNVAERLGQVPDTKAKVIIKPSYGLEPFEDSFYLAVYIAHGDADAPDTIKIYAPHSYTFGFYNADAGWDAGLERVLSHEYTHLVHRRSYDNAGHMAVWMSEGLAEFVAGDRHTYEMREAVRAGAIIPIVDSETPVYKQDLQHMNGLKVDQGLAYGFAYTLVAYVDERYGGLPGFWKLARAYDKTQNLDKALQQALGVGYAEFDRGWREWLAEKYG